MAPTGAVEVHQLSFNELLCHLAAAHEREIIDLQTEVKQLRDSKDDASSKARESSGEVSASGSGSCPLEMSAFPSRQPTLASTGTEDYEPMPEDTEACLPVLEKSEELPPRAPCLTKRQVRSDLTPVTIRKRKEGPDAKALASALQIAQTLGLGAIDEDHTFEEAEDLLFSEAASSEPITAEFHVDAAGEVSPDAARVNQLKQSSLALPQVTPAQKSFLPSCPLDDHEPLPEEDKSSLATSTTSPRQRREKGPTTSANTSTDLTPCRREWSLVSEKTGDAASPIPVTLGTGLGLDSGLGLSANIWVEASDHGRFRPPATPSHSKADAPGTLSPRLNAPSEREGSRHGLEFQDVELEGQEHSELEEIEIDKISEVDKISEASFANMRRERLLSTLPSLEQTLVVSGPVEL